METNPYQSPASDDLDIVTASSAAKFRVDGKYLVVRSGAVLPPSCVKTGVAVEPQSMRRAHLIWCTPWIIVLFLLSGLIAVLFYFLLRKHCKIAYGVSPEVRRKYRLRIVWKSLAAVVLLVAVPFSAATESTLFIVLAIVFFLVAVVAIFVGNAPLSVKKFRQGEFWIAGCSRDFLALAAQGEAA